MFDCELAELIAVFTCRPAWPVGCPVRGGLTMGLTSSVLGPVSSRVCGHVETHPT